MTKESAKATEKGSASLSSRLADLEKQLAEKESELAALKEELEKKSSDCQDYLDALRRLQAESENFRKRMLREQTQVIEFATQNIICELLPLVDNLERAVAASKEGKDVDKITEGIELIHGQLQTILEQCGLEAIEPTGNEFDPEYHEAVLQVESEEHEDNTVVEVMQKGYCLKGKVIRPAMVKVTRKS